MSHREKNDRYWRSFIAVVVVVAVEGVVSGCMVAVTVVE